MIGSGAEKIPCASSSSINSESASGSPDRTVKSGLFSAATEIRPSRPCRRRRASSRESSTTAMRPRPSTRCMSRLRCAITLTPSSRVRAPATQAAATSPKLWPTTRSGVMPRVRHHSVRAICMAKSTGWFTAVWSSREAPSSAINSSTSDQSTYRRNSASHRSITARKRGSSRMSWRPMPHHWEPCPEKTKQIGPGAAGSGAMPSSRAIASSRSARSSSWSWKAKAAR